MEKYRDLILKFFKNPMFIIPLIIVTIGSFGYLLGHATVNVDTLSADRYYGENVLIKQGRLMAPLIDKIFNIMNFYPFLVDFIAVLLLMLAAVLFCSLFDSVSKGKIKMIAYTIFACFFVSYPLIMEAFVFEPMGISIALGFCFIALSLILFNEYWKNKNIKKYICGTIFLWFAISLYESFAVVYVMGVFLLLLLKILYENETKQSIKEYILTGLKFAIPLVIVVLFNCIITNMIILIWQKEINLYADKNILYGDLGIAGGIKNLFNTVMEKYIINGLGYLPITFLVISSLISFVLGIILSVKKRNFLIFLSILGMNLSLLMLSIIQGKASYYRTCQQFYLFVSFIFMILTQCILNMNIKKYFKNAFLFIMFLMIFYQVKEISKLQYINDLRYQKEKNDMILIANELQAKYDVENKAVIFIGEYELPSCVKEAVGIKKGSLHYKVLDYFNKKFNNEEIDLDNYIIVENSVKSYIDWAKSAFSFEEKANIENIKFFKYLGYDFKVGITDDEAFYDIANTLTNRKIIPNSWPKEGSIVEIDEYILVFL